MAAKWSLLAQVDGRKLPIDALAVATDDLIMTAMVRIDFALDATSLTWLRDRMLAHAEECLSERVDETKYADAYKAFAAAITSVIDREG